IKEARCAYTILVMATFWITEVIPLPATALIPLIFYPFLGVMPGKDVAKYYMQDSTMIFIAGLMMALAIEKVDLHKRVATGILLKIGATPTKILIGFVIPAWFLSMWISNTAATSMLVPAVEAVSGQMRLGMKKSKIARFDIFINHYKFDDNLGSTFHVDDTTDTKVTTTINPITNELDSIELDPKDEKKLKNLSKMLCLAIAYSANIGGTATLTGSPTNLLVSEAAARSVFNMQSPLTYSTWLFMGFPVSLLCIIALAFWLKLVFLGWRFVCSIVCLYQERALKKIMRAEYEKLGKITFGEISTAVLLLVMVLLWLTRDPGFIPGYASLFKDGYVTDASPAIIIVVLLFMYPMEKPRWLCMRARDEPALSVPSLLDWHTVTTKLPWGPILLLGGGYAMAEGCERSGLTKLIGQQLSGIGSYEPWIIALIVTTIITFLTEIMSNTAIIALFLPILEAMSRDINLNPLYLMLPAGLAASFAFMLPIATPPNAIVFSFGHLKVPDMMKMGFIMNIIGIAVVTMAINTWGIPLFNLHQSPWNATISSNITSG
ncbi:hypothetical protein HELRODRAFT_84633, partial [Helobdella robusta]|uniref:Citrate transporter-like domain-containing protein n=1 Tax=Helobdella robusta TaxID=6412 RepID=T1G5L3_HELRO